MYIHKFAKYTIIALSIITLPACISTNNSKSKDNANQVTLSKEELSINAQKQEKIYKQNPENHQNTYAYAETLGALGKSEQQSAVLEKLVMNQGGTPETLAAYGKSLIAIGEYARADQVLMQAYMPDAPDWRTLSARGVANDKLGNHKIAQDLYHSALRIQPNETSVLTNLGLSYAYERNYAKAETTLRQAAANPDADKRTHQNLAVILGLQGKSESQKQELARGNTRDEANTALNSISDQKQARQNTKLR